MLNNTKVYRLSIRQSGAKVQPVDPYLYYKLGLAMAALLSLKEEPAFREIFFEVIDAQNALDDLMSSGLEHSKAAAADVKKSLHDLPKDAVTEDGKPDFSKPIQSWRVNTMKQTVRDLQTILIRECPTLPVFFIPQKGLHRTVDLINHAELDFPEEIRKAIPTNALEELRQGGKALALDMFTAHAFHAMRAAELIILLLLHDYHSAPLRDSDRNWGNYIEIIKKNGGDPELVRYLNEMARIERNEGIHPTKLLNETEADMRYGVAKGAIMAMIRDLNNRSFYDSLVPAIRPTQMRLSAATRLLTGTGSE